MKLYYHKTSGGAEYLFDTFIKCANGHKEGAIKPSTKYVVRIDGDITKDAELNIRDKASIESLKNEARTLAIAVKERSDDSSLVFLANSLLKSIK